MNAMVNPEFRELQQKVEDMRINLAKTQGEIEIIRHNSERNDRQTIKQFVIFTITMLIAVVTCLIGTSIFQTDALRREINARFDGMNQRQESLEKRMEKMEKSIEDLREEFRNSRPPTRR
jgi:peptidoglycan hydrolase CwlO-like protein